MPYKSENCRLSGTKFDRRVKLSEDQKEYIRWLAEEEKISQRQLAKMFGVHRRLIAFILHPEKYQKCREQLRMRKLQGKYVPSKEKWAETIREHRHYKQKLFVEGKIQLPKTSDNLQK